MKKFSSLLLTSLLLFSSMAVTGAEGSSSNITVYINGQVQEYEQSPVIERDFTLVPLRGIFESLGASLSWDDKAKKITVTKDSIRIIMTVGSDTALINGMPVTLDVSPKIMNGRTMIPLRFVSEALGSEVKWDGATKQIHINTKESKATKLTFELALSYAEKNSPSLKKAIADIERSEEVRDKAGDNLNFTPLGTGNGSNDALERSALKGLQQADISLQMTKKNVDTLKDALYFKVRKSYDEILQKQKEMQLAELTLNHVLSQERITNIKAEAGLASESDTIQAQNNVQEAKEKLEAANKALADSEQKFNQLLGLDNGETYVLEDYPSFEKLMEVNLDHHVRNVVAENPSLWSLEKQVDLAKLDVDLYTFNDPSNPIPYKAKEIDVTKAQLTLADTKQQLEESIRTMYYNIRQLENQIGVLQANLAKAEQGQKMVQAKYDVGMAIEAELTEVTLSVEQLKQQIFNVTVQHEQLKIAFEKPWVLAGN
ncbi:stalk domain-containing protein [Ammoniphilus sp. 3BR4]